MSYYAVNLWTAKPEDWGFCEDEYQFFLGWQEAVASLIAIWPAAGRSEVLSLQRIINADIADACGRQGTWILDSWAEDHAKDVQGFAEAAVAHMAAGDRDGALHVIDGMQDLISHALERAEAPEKWESY